ncbi:putative radial spoke head protein 9 [Paratrimastix pyriformis]|uniref:Radial spoke head protein 9 homolog n=1 Tax=Paratrimastix pyriformis TaxID=342808 RepID=A0ABQ8UFW8_9EUKA|nr:putative radial spoke head protein 9 [Paratrimastix pyriformis]
MCSIDFQLFDDAGVVWSPREKVALRSVLPDLQKRYALKNIYPWGKVTGLNGDYLIVQGRQEWLDEPTTLYSLDCVNWAQLPEIDEEAMSKCNKMPDLFFGNPNHEYIIREKIIDPTQPPEPASKEIALGEDGTPLPDPEEEEEDKPEEGAADASEPKKKSPYKKTTFKEDKRLAVFVHQVDASTALVPRGYLMVNATHNVVLNRMFQGLPQSEALKASAYMHQRAPEQGDRLAVLQQEGLTETRDFLDTIEGDAPVGCWSMQYDAAVRLVLLRNLLWPGSVFFMRPETSQWGRCYVGTGVQNTDIAFMLAPNRNPVPGKALMEVVDATNAEMERKLLEKTAPPQPAEGEEAAGEAPADA